MLSFQLLHLHSKVKYPNGDISHVSSPNQPCFTITQKVDHSLTSNHLSNLALTMKQRKRCCILFCLSKGCRKRSFLQLVPTSRKCIHKDQILKPADSSKVESAFHLSIVDQMSTRTPGDLVIESKLTPCKGSATLKQLSAIDKKGHNCSYVKTEN